MNLKSKNTKKKKIKKISWGLRFDQLAHANNGYFESYESKCTNITSLDIDVSQQTKINYNLSEYTLNEWLSNDNSQVYEPPNGDSFGNNMTTTARWVISLMLAFLYDLFVIYFVKLIFSSFFTIFTFDKNNKDEGYFWENDNFFLQIGGTSAASPSDGGNTNNDSPQNNENSMNDKENMEKIETLHKQMIAAENENDIIEHSIHMDQINIVFNIQQNNDNNINISLTQPPQPQPPLPQNSPEPPTPPSHNLENEESISISSENNNQNTGGMNQTANKGKKENRIKLYNNQK